MYFNEYDAIGLTLNRDLIRSKEPHPGRNRKEKREKKINPQKGVHTNEINHVM